MDCSRDLDAMLRSLGTSVLITTGQEAGDDGDKFMCSIFCCC